MVYKLGEVPLSLSWDEVAVGYNAYTIANYGKDEHGNLPHPFRSFGEDKQPIHIYITALFVKLFDLSEFSTRLPAALFGVLTVLLIFYLTRNLFNNSVGLLASLFLAIFGSYAFGGWNAVESPAAKGVLYVLSPSEYDGLMHRSDFDVKKIIYYPNGTIAFYLVSLK